MSDIFSENNQRENMKEIFDPHKINQKSEFLFFKNEILKEINQFKTNFSKQNKEIKDDFKDKMKLYESTINKMKTDFQQISSVIASNNFIKEKIEEMEKFKKEVTDLSSSNKIKLNFLERETQDNIFRINNIINTSVLYPRVIGNNSKFKNFHEFIDYTLSQLSATNSFQTKIELDLKSFKAKIDKTIQSLKVQIEMAVNTSSQLVKNGLQETENRIREFVNERVLNIQIKNKELESRIEKAMIDLNNGINNINDKTNELNSQLREEIEKFNAEAKILYKNIEECKFDNKEVRTTMNNLEILMEKKTDCEFMIENNKNEIVNIVKDLIENEKILPNEKKQTISISKNINEESIDVDNRIQNKNSIKMIKEKKPSSSYIKRNKNYLIESRNKNEASFTKEKEKYTDKSNNNLPKFDVLIEKKNFLNANYNANKKGVYTNNIYSNHNKQNSMVNSSSINNTYDKEKISNFNTYAEENNKNPINHYHKGKNYLQNYEDDNKNINNILNNQNANLTTIKYLGKKKQELKNPLKTLLKLKLDLKDIDAKIRNDSGEKTSSNEHWNRANKINEKTIENNFPISSRIDFRKKKFKEKYGFNSKNEIRSKINYESIGVKDNVKLKATTLKSLYSKDDNDKKDNKNNLIDNDSNQISRNENKFSLTEFSNTFNKSNKIINKLKTSKSFKNKYLNQM